MSLRNSVVADAADGPRFLLTHVEDIEERKRRELQLAHRASHDSLTGLPNSAELRSRLSSRLCASAPTATRAPWRRWTRPSATRPSTRTATASTSGPAVSRRTTAYDHHVHTVAP